jgi:hypothetical protein
MASNMPEVTVSFRPIYDMVVQSPAINLLMSSIDLQIYDVLADWKAAQDVATALETYPANTAFFLDGLTSIGLLEKRDGRYQNTALADTYLVTGKPTYIGGFLKMIESWNIPTAEMMLDAVKHGPPPPNPDLDAGDMEVWAQIHRAVGNVQRAGFGQQIAGIVSELPEFPSMKRMLDLGAGARLVGICIVASHPTMEGVIYDQPAVTPVAEEFIKEYELASRVTTMGGNFMTDAIGEGYDLIVASQTLGFAGQQFDDIIKKLHKALNPGGVLITIHEGLTDERTQPTSIILPFLGMGLRGQLEVLRQFEAGETAASMLRGGFTSVHRFPEVMPVADHEITIGRK